MARSPKRQFRSSALPRWPLMGLGLTLLSPLTVFVAVAGLKAGLFSIETAYETLTMLVGLGLAGLGVVGALIALVGGAMAFRRAWLVSLAALVVSATTVTLFEREFSAQSRYASENPGATTDAQEPLGFSNAIMAERRASGADPLPSKDGRCEIVHLPMQSAPGTAGYALQEAGFEIRDLGVNRANGVYTSFWFDRTYDAAIRIRPGRTDLRVAPRDDRRDHGTSCRLARKILTELQPSR